MPKKVGRPSKFDQKIADLICEEMVQGLSLLRIIKKYPDLKIDRVTIWRWQKNMPEFRNWYALARECLADHYFDQCIEISDDGLNDTYTDEKGNTRTDHDVVHRSRLRVETRKWTAARMAPWKYHEGAQSSQNENESKKQWPGKIEVIEHKKPTEPIQ